VLIFVQEAETQRQRELVLQLAIPGGWRGVQHLEHDEQLHELVQAHVAAKRPLAAVCSAPNLLRRWGCVGEAQRFTAHPASLGFATGGRAQPDSIVREPLLITGISATATLPWALAVVEQLWGSALRQEVEQRMGPAA
jgi:putative intracellular protease/amidase